MDKSLIAYRLKQLRGDMDRDFVAKSLGVSVSALQMYETEQRIPRDDIKVQIAEFYNVSVQDIFFNIIEHNKCPGTSEEVIS
ncbi:helix-turn-helix transcriptional regulator [Lentibacillus salicampi]|uniref:XRE family transcriptional regulator n=1 Tax=Lentibacillus salicampi TaxID=175306 RepID=A0A4Y9ACW1_9BACI|nr:helix-turn-helix transcriptional regulator [Lentibacillus salicampi]TFJ93152.1 XRE family transcriptional regulator [Lentibacillus salicampi]